jgi:hypothetical protein
MVANPQAADLVTVRVVSSVSEVLELVCTIFYGSRG